MMVRATKAAKAMNAIKGGSGNDVLNGPTLGDLMEGMGGNVGNDAVYGGIGNDVLIGEEIGMRFDTGAGDDLYIVDTFDQWAHLGIRQLAGGGIDTIRTIAKTATVATNIENLEFVGTGEAADYGNAPGNLVTLGTGNERAWGHDSNDTPLGGMGDDTLHSGADTDVLEGGLGADVLRGGSGRMSSCSAAPPTATPRTGST